MEPDESQKKMYGYNMIQLIGRIFATSCEILTDKADGARDNDHAEFSSCVAPPKSKRRNDQEFGQIGITHIYDLRNALHISHGTGQWVWYK